MRRGSSDPQATLIRRASGSSELRHASWTLPPDILSQAARRLRVLALLYAFVFFMAGVFPALVMAEHRGHFLGSIALWGPSAISITTAILVAALIRNARVPLSAVTSIGLVFEVVSAYGIAAAEFLDPQVLTPPIRWFGLSWVAPWTLLFTVVIPTPPRHAVAAALASVSSVPVVIGLNLAFNDLAISLHPLQFFLGLVLPYLLVVVMAYVGARVVYALGAEVSRARELGSYRLEERLGEGGMGEVWRARHSMLARPAAIKLIRPSIARDGRVGTSDEARRRFEREAQAIASLRSPHTVNLFDFGVASDGAFYYVMELLEGLDLQTLVRQYGPVPAERAIHLLRQVCHSLSEADSIGLVHRDIKPANIFVCRYGEDVDFVKVLDFGLVKAVHDTAEENLGLTRDNFVPGTPAFIAPEQILGGAVLDGRTDIYTTGCVAYWLLTGQTVFTAATPTALMLDHAQTMPLPPSARTEWPIPPALDGLVLACLEKDPANRPQSASELARRLGEIAVDETWTDARARDWWTMHRPTTT